jgi:hypothetical protein
MEGTEYISNAYHMRELIEGVAWTDVKAEILDMLNNIKEDLITCKSRAEIYRYQGRAEALKAVLLLPENILAYMEDVKISDEELEEE